jgi:hypothetical protein
MKTNAWHTAMRTPCLVVAIAQHIGRKLLLCLLPGLSWQHQGGDVWHNERSVLVVVIKDVP